MKANLEKMSRLRLEYQEEKEQMVREIRMLRMDNGRLGQMLALAKANQTNNMQKLKKTDEL